MQNLLKALWYGNLNPCEDFSQKTPNEKKTFQKYYEYTEKLEALLSKDLLELFEKREDLATDIHVEAEANAFINGYCLATMLMIEVFEQSAKNTTGRQKNNAP